MRIGRHRYFVELGHLLVATLVAATCVAYLLDARATSLSINNLLVLQPAAILAVVLYVLIAAQCFRRAPADEADSEARGETAQATRLDLIRTAALAAALGLFTFSFETIGVDVSTLIFLMVAVFLCGERRPAWLVLYPLGLTVMLIEGYQQLIPYPLMTLVL